MFISKLTTKANFYTTLLIITGIIIAVNIIFSFFPLKIDLTENKIFSTSAVTQRILKNLDDVVTIKAYFTKDLPGYFVDVREGTRDMLQEYQSLSGGKIKLQFIDPSENDDLKQEAMRLGIPPVQLNTIKNDKREAVQVFLGLAVFYADKQEVIPLVQDIGSLEYDLTSTIKKITLAETPKIALIEDYGSLKSDQDLQNVNQVLAKEYDVEKLTLKDTAELDQVKTIILPGLKEKIDDQDLENLKNLIQQGKALIVLEEGVGVDNNLKTTVLNTGINKILSNYGVQLNEDLIVDPASNSQAPFSNGFLPFLIPYAFWPNITEQGFNNESGIVNKLQSIILPWVSSISSAKVKEGYQVDVLAETSSQSELVKNSFNLDPQKYPQTEEGSTGKHTAALHLYNKPETKNLANIILVSDSDFIRDNLLANFRDYNLFNENLIFFQNLVDSVSLDQDLITIRSKGEAERPLKEVSAEVRSMLKYLNIFGVSILFCGIGLARFLVRRRLGRE